MKCGSGSKLVRAVTCEGSGSAMRSGTCPFEHAYLGFRDEQGDKWRWFNAAAAWHSEFLPGHSYTIEARWNNGTLARVKLV